MEKEPDKKYETMKKVMDALKDILCSYQGRGHLSVYRVIIVSIDVYE